MRHSLIRAIVRSVLLVFAYLVVHFPLLAQSSQHRSGRAPYWTAVGEASDSAVEASQTKGVQAGMSRASLGSSADLVVDSLNLIGAGTDASLCTNGCFAVSAGQSTVPYYSLDKPRNVTLRYNSEIAAPRPIAFVDVHIDPGSTKTLKEYWLQIKRNGANLTFLNGDTKLRFTAPSPQSTGVRLAGQYDNRGIVTVLDSLTYTVTAVWSDNTTQSMSFQAWFVNPSGLWTATCVGRGWYLDGVQILLTHASGRLFVFNGDGSTSMFSPAGCGAYQTETNGDFSTITTSGSGSGLVYTRTYPDSSRAQFDYIGRMIRSISTTLDTISYGYDGTSWRVTRIYDPFRKYSGTNASFLNLYYAVNGLLQQIREPGGDGTPYAGRITNVTISASDSTLTAIQDPDGISTTYQYNANKLLEKIINRRGDTTRFVYNTNSWLADSLIGPRIPVDAGGGSTTNQTPATAYTPWQAIGVPTTTTVTTAATPAAWSAIKARVRDPMARTTTYTVNIDGQSLAISTPLGQTTTIARDTSWTELPYRMTYPTGGSDTLAFTANTSNLIYSMSAGDSATHYHYGVSGQVDSVWTTGELARRDFLNSVSALPDSTRLGGYDSLVTRYTYDSYRRVVTTRDVSGHVTTYHYDPVFGNMDSTSAPGGIYTRRIFDAFGRDTAHIAKGELYWTRLQYDTLNRPAKAWHRGVTGDTAATTYDALYPTRMKVPSGSTIYKLETNALGLITKRYDGVDTTRYATYRYDIGGNLTSWTNRRGQRIDVLSDSLGRTIRVSGPTIPTDTFTFSPDGLIQTARRGGAGSPVSLDSAFFGVSGQSDSVIHRIAGHRYAVVTPSTESVNATHGSMTVTSNAGITFVQASLASQFGSTSRDSSTLSPGAGAGSMEWTYNRDSVLTQVKWPSGPTKTLGYTSLIQLSTASFGGSGALNDSLSRDYQRDSLGRLVNEWRKSGSAYERRTYVYDGLGRLTYVKRATVSGCTVTTDSILGKSYSCSTTIPFATEDSVGYDVGGNRILPGASYTTTGNQMLAWPVGGITYTSTYDADGNVITRSHSGTTDSLFWSATNQLDSVRSGGVRRQWEYNSAGYVVRRSTNGNIDRHFLWDGDQLIAELDSSGTHRVAQYLYHGLDQPYALVTDSGGAPLVRYFQFDALGNVTGVLRGNALAQFTRYTGWGKVDARPINTLGDTNRLGWKGLVFTGDSTWPTYFVRHRWYDAQAGRFGSEDPIGLDGGQNLYTFADNDPINSSDPTGLRKLNSIEVRKLSSICSVIFCSSVNVYDLGWRATSSNTAQDSSDIRTNQSRMHFAALDRGYTEGSNIYITEYREDLDNKDISLLAHELTHVWQNQNVWGSVLGWIYGAGHAIENFFGHSPYSYQWTPLKPFSYYTSEQQAQIVQDCYDPRGSHQTCRTPGYPFPTLYAGYWYW